MTDSPKTPRRYSHRRQLSKIKSEPRRRSSGLVVPSGTSPDARVHKYGALGSPGANGSHHKARVISQSTGLAKLMLVEMNRDLNRQFDNLAKLQRIDSMSDRDTSGSGSSNGRGGSSTASVRSDVSSFTSDPNVTEDDILKAIAAKQRKVLDLKTELALAEREISILSDKYSAMVTRRTVGTSESASDPNKSPQRGGTPRAEPENGLFGQLKRSSTFRSVRESIGMGNADDNDLPIKEYKGSPRRESRRQSMLPSALSPYSEVKEATAEMTSSPSPRLSIAKKKSLMFRAQRAFQQQQPSLKLKHSSQQLKQSIQNGTDELLIKGHRLFNDIAKEFMSSDDEGEYDWNEDSDIDEADFEGPVERL
ncbi:Hypothetical protein conserved in the Yarrowia clade [Yarrowia lipolytica]|jgi:hypothetical protein|nr:Hypothetical protein YALI2_D00153g [Yarrowia lipolytica]VBB87816.1 Hypothetical protein conserved in the Yarrowia clade [Yarrowia lipolytica]